MTAPQSPATGRNIAILMWSAGLDDVERLAAPFYFAQAAAALEVKVEMFFTGPAVRLLIVDSGPVFVGYGASPKSVSQYLADTNAAGVRLYACSQALAGFGYAKDQLTDVCAGLGGAVQFMSRAIDPAWCPVTF